MKVKTINEYYNILQHDAELEKATGAVRSAYGHIFGIEVQKSPKHVPI